MTVFGPEHEAPRPAEGEGFSDAVTISFGDAARELYGVARIGLAEGRASGLLILFRRGEPVAVAAEGGVEVPVRPAWEEVSAAGIDTCVDEPLARWRLAFAGDEASLDLELAATGALAALPPEDRVAAAGGMMGYDQPVRVTGQAMVGGERIAVEGLGQRGHSWGAPDWDRIELARTLGVWMGDDLAVSLTAVRRAGKRDHAHEDVTATILARDREGEPVALAVEDPRLSTTYDAEGRQRHAGLELWVDDEWPRRAAGQVACGTSLDLGRLRLQCAFFRWRMEGREGVGRYDILQRA